MTTASCTDEDEFYDENAEDAEVDPHGRRMRLAARARLAPLPWAPDGGHGYLVDA